MCYICVTAGLPISETHTKNQSADEPEGLKHFGDHWWEALGKENSDLSGLFLFRHYSESYVEKEVKMDHTKIDHSDLNSPRRELSNGGIGTAVVLLVP